jgi:hypothetical protein
LQIEALAGYQRAKRGRSVKAWLSSAGAFDEQLEICMVIA